MVEEEFQGGAVTNNGTINISGEDSEVKFGALTFNDSGSINMDWKSALSFTGFNNGDVKVITETIGEGDEAKLRTYVVQKLDILSVPAAKTDPARDSIRENLKKPEFEELLRTTGEGYTLTKDGSISLYTVNKLLGE